MLQHPDITQIERTGGLEPPKLYVCPRCGAELSGEDVVYLSFSDQVEGCRNCLFPVEAGEVLEHPLS